MALAFVVFTFLIWRDARNHGIVDEKIFDNILSVTLAILTMSRVFFLVTHWSIFSPNLLRSFLVWKYPGLSFWGGIFGGVVTFYVLGRKQGLSSMRLFDMYARALPLALFFISLGIFLDGSVVGRETRWVTGMAQVGLTGKHHPVGLYGLVLVILFMVSMLFAWRIQVKKSLSHGFSGWIALSFLGLGELLLAFFRSDTLYWNGFSVDYIIATILFVGPWGPIYKEIHGTELIKKSLATLKKRGESIYAKISKTRFDRH